MVTDELLTRVLRNMRLGIPVEDILANCLADNIREVDVYLAVKGAEILMRKDNIPLM